MILQWKLSVKLCLLFVVLVENSINIVRATDEIQVILKPCDKCETTTYKIFEISNDSAIHSIELNTLSNSYFFIVQVHSYLDEVEFSYDITPNRTNSVCGTDIGLNQIIIPDKTEYSFYLFNNFTKNEQILVAVTSYLKTDPMPGGCNMEFNTLTAPYQRLSFTEDIITIDIQNSSVYNRRCELQENIVIEFYKLFTYGETQNSTFNTIINMMTVDKIKANGIKVPIPYYGSNLRRYYSNYLGFGTVYAVVVSNGNNSTAYVPIFSYGCDMHGGTESCLKSLQADWTMMQVIEFASLIVLLSPFKVLAPIYTFGYYSSKAVVTFAKDSILFATLSYTIAGVLLPISCILAVFAKRYKVDKIIMRFYIGQIIFACTYISIAAYGYSQSSGLIWIVYAFIWAILIMPFDYVTYFAYYTNISFRLILVADILIGNKSQMYINIDPVRRATIANFYLANTYAPFTTKTCEILVKVYVALALVVYYIHIFCCKGRTYSDDSSSDDSSSDNSSESSNETQPLLA